MKVSTIGLDTAKNVFQLHGTDDTGYEVLRRQLRRGEQARRNVPDPQTPSGPAAPTSRVTRPDT